MSIPMARAKLLQVVKDLQQPCPMPKYAAMAIQKIIDEEMFRAVPISRAPRKIAPLTDDQKRLIRRQHELRPDMSQLEIANMFGTNPGRVSEALNEGT